MWVHLLLALVGAAIVWSCSSGGGGGSTPTVPWSTFQANSLRSGISTGLVGTNAGTATRLFQVSTGRPTLSSPVIGRFGIVIGTTTGVLALTTRGEFRWSFESYSRKCLRSATACHSDDQCTAGDTCGGCTVCAAGTPGCISVGPINGSPSVAASGDIVVGTEGGQVFGLVDDGKSNMVTCVWVAHAEDQTFGPVRSSPGIVINTSDATISAASLGTDKGFLVALNGLSGDQIWRFPPGDSLGAITSSPALAGNGTSFITAPDGSLRAISSTGVQLWQAQVGTSVSDVDFLPSPAFGPSVYATGPDGDAGVIVAVTVNGTVKWRVPTDAPVLGSPIYGQRTVTVVATPSATPGPPPTPTPTPPTTFDTVVYAIDTNGTLYGVRDQTGQLIVDPPVFVAGSPPGVESSPVLSGDVYVVVVGTDGRLYASTIDGTSPCNPPTGTPTPSKCEWPVSVGAPFVSSPILNTDGRIYVTAADGFLYLIGTPFS